MELQYLKGKFNYCKNISWDEVIEKISKGYVNGNPMISLCSETLPPTFVLRDNYLSGRLRKSYSIVKKKWGINYMHVYTSLGSGARTFGNHVDEEDVLIVQSVGRVNYRINNKYIEVNPGDGIIIPGGIFHEPIIGEPRITLSFAWDKTPWDDD